MTAAGSTTGVDDIDLWVGGLAEERPSNVGGGGGAGTNLLGDTFNHVFQDTLTNLQEGDRFYYLGRLAGLQLLTAVEGNTLADMFIRNSDLDTLPALLFEVPGVVIDAQPTPATATPALGAGDGTISVDAVVAAGPGRFGRPAPRRHLHRTSGRGRARKRRQRSAGRQRWQ